MIILGTGCIGKTTLGKKYKNCVDLESSDYQWVFTDEYLKVDTEKRKGIEFVRTLNPEWPENYISAVLRKHKKGYIVLAGVFQDLINFLNENNYEFFGVVSPEGFAEELSKRSIERGNSEKFANNLIKVFDEHNRRAKLAPKLIKLKENGYLEGALVEMGVELVKAPEM